MRALKILLLFASAASLAGCATVSTAPTQDITVHALDARERPVAGLECVALNAEGEQRFTTPSATIRVRRSHSELRIDCRRGDEDVAKAVVVPRRDWLEQALLPFGWVAVTVDHVTGHLYTYPTVVRMRLGKHLRFEHSQEAQASQELATLNDAQVVDLQAGAVTRQPMPGPRAATAPAVPQAEAGPAKPPVRARADRPRATPPPVNQNVVPGVNAPLTW
jgi:hypothetical protein